MSAESSSNISTNSLIWWRGVHKIFSLSNTGRFCPSSSNILHDLPSPCSGGTVLGDHSVVFRPTETRPEVQQEMNLAAQRIRAEHAKRERASIISLSSTMDLLAKKYDRYNLLTHTNVLKTRCDADGLHCIIPRELMGIWLYADTTMDPTQEESAMYEFHIRQQVRPPPVYSPDLPRPSVNWTNHECAG